LNGFSVLRDGAERMLIREYGAPLHAGATGVRNGSTDLLTTDGFLFARHFIEWGTGDHFVVDRDSDSRVGSSFKVAAQLCIIDHFFSHQSSMVSKKRSMPGIIYIW
jgi:hypothetical protein